MSIRLTKNDVLELLSQQKADVKADVTKKICIEYAQALYSPEELQIAEQIFRVLCNDSEILVRSTLSESLKLCNDLPHDIAVSLANDIAEVAIPIIEYSNVLTDDDLKNIIENKEVQKIVAISRRQKLSHALVKNLIAFGDRNVIEKVMGHPDFATSEENFVDIIDHFASDEKAIKNIIGGARYTATIREKLINFKAGSFLSKLKKKYHILPKKVDTYVSHSAEISTLAVIDHHSSASEIDYLINHLSNQNRLTPSLILSALCTGKRRFFIASMAKRAGIPKENATALIHQGGSKGMSMLLDKAGIPQKLHSAIDIVFRLAEEKKSTNKSISVKDFCAWLVKKLEKFAPNEETEYLSYMLALAKQNKI